MAYALKPGATKTSSSVKNCSDWASAAFGFNNPVIVQWLRDAAGFSPEVSKDARKVKALQAQVDELTYALAQEKAM